MYSVFQDTCIVAGERVRRPFDFIGFFFLALPPQPHTEKWIFASSHEYEKKIFSASIKSLKRARM